MEENKRDLKMIIKETAERVKALIPDRVKELLQIKKFQGYLVLGAGAALLLIYLVFALIPKWSFFNKTLSDIKDLKEKISLVDGRIGRIDVLTNKLEKLTSEIESYSDGLPEQKELPQFLEELSLTAEESGVKILSITPAPPSKVDKSGEYYREAPIVITAESGYHELGDFISNLEESERFITIEDLLIRSDVKIPRKHKVTINLKTYVYIAS